MKPVDMHSMIMMEMCGWKESKYGKVIEELMRNKDENEENNENDCWIERLPLGQKL